MELKELMKKYEENEKYSPRIKVREYLTTGEKIELLEDLTEVCIELNEQGFYRIDYISLEANIDIFIVSTCTNIELGEYDEDETVLDKYDFLIEKGIIEEIRKKIKGTNIERTINDIYKSLERDIATYNSVENMLARAINTIIERIPSQEDILKVITEMKNFDPSKVAMLEKLFSFANGVKQEQEEKPTGIPIPKNLQ